MVARGAAAKGKRRKGYCRLPGQAFRKVRGFFPPLHSRLGRKIPLSARCLQVGVMSVKNPRTKIINFRLSEEEFERLKSACQGNGSRSVSDFARSAVLWCLEEQVTSNSFGSGHSSLVDEKIASLETRVEQLVCLFRATTPDLSAGLPFLSEGAELQQITS